MFFDVSMDRFHSAMYLEKRVILLIILRWFGFGMVVDTVGNESGWTLYSTLSPQVSQIDAISKGFKKIKPDTTGYV